MKPWRGWPLTAGIAAILAATPAAAQVTLGFDDLPSNFDPVPGSYRGFGFSNFYVANDGAMPGYATSGSNWAYAGCCGVADAVFRDALFTFHSAYLAAIDSYWSFTLVAFRNGVEVYRQQVALTPTPTLFVFDWTGVDRVQFGSNHYANLALDDLTLGEYDPTVTPEPATVVLLASGLAGLAGVALLCGGTLFLMDVVELRPRVRDGARDPFDLASLVALAKYGAAGVTLLVLAGSARRALRDPAPVRKRRGTPPALATRPARTPVSGA